MLKNHVVLLYPLTKKIVYFIFCTKKKEKKRIANNKQNVYIHTSSLTIKKKQKDNMRTMEISYGSLCLFQLKTTMNIKSCSRWKVHTMTSCIPHKQIIYKLSKLEGQFYQHSKPSFFSFLFLSVLESRRIQHKKFLYFRHIYK